MKILISKTGIVSTEERQRMWMEDINKKYILYFGCHSGMGKTSQAVFLAQEYFPCSLLIDAEQPDVYQKAKTWLCESEGKNVRRLLIVDNITYLKETDEQAADIKRLVQEKTEQESFALILIGRVNCPIWLNPYRLDGQMLCYGREIMALSREEAYEILRNEVMGGMENLDADDRKWLEKLTDESIACANRCGLGIYDYAVCAKESYDKNLSCEERTKDLMWAQLEKAAEGTIEESVQRCMQKASVFSYFDAEMLAEIMNETEVQVFQENLSICSYIAKDENENYQIDRIFREYAAQNMKKTDAENYRKTLVLAGRSCEKRHRYEEALQLYQKSEDKKELARALAEIMEKADGTSLVRICYPFFEVFDQTDYKENPELLFAKIMMESFRMRPDESEQYLAMLKKLERQEKEANIYGPARKNYIKTMLALPHQSPSGFQDMSASFMEILMNDADYVGKTQPTGGGPSVIDGGIDQMDWAFEEDGIYEYMKSVAAPMLGVDGRGIADVGLGEYYLERNERLKSVNYLMMGLSELKGRENFRGYFTGSAIMARGFLEENRMDTAKDIMSKLVEQVQTSDFPELEENVRATYIECLLYKGVDAQVTQWVEYEKTEGVGNLLHTEFFISERHRVYVLAKAYIAMGKYLEAAVLIRQLVLFAERYARKYLAVKMQLMNAILCEEQDADGTEYVISAVLTAAKTGYVRIIADEGAALLPIWRKIDWEEVIEQHFEELPENFAHYLKKVEKELKVMAANYPAYLKFSTEGILLSKTEKMVMDLIYSGNSNEKIAMKMDISLSTVKFHVSNIYKKLGVKKRNQAVKKVAEMGWNP